MLSRVPQALSAVDSKSHDQILGFGPEKRCDVEHSHPQDGSST